MSQNAQRGRVMFADPKLTFCHSAKDAQCQHPVLVLPLDDVEALVERVSRLEADKARLEERIAEIDFLTDATKISTPFQTLELELEEKSKRLLLAETAVTACHAAMLGKVNPKHPAWACVYAAQDAARAALREGGRA